MVAGFLHVTFYMEVATGLLFVMSVAKYGITLNALRTILLISVLIPAAAVDFRCKIIPDEINLAGFVLGLPLIFESKAVFSSSVTGFFVGEDCCF